MSDDGFVKIYGSKLRQSTLWLEPPDVRLVFLLMLAMADESGVVDVPNRSVRVLANLLNLPEDYVDAALCVLEAPDLDSRTPDEEGRRVLRLEGGAGFRCVNHAKYREYQSAAQIRKREATRKRVAEHRARKKGDGDERYGNAVAPGHAQARPEAEAEAEAEEEAGPERTTTTASPARVAETMPASPPPRGRPTRNEEGVAKVFRTAARGAYQRAGHLTVGMLYPTVVHREEFSVMSANCGQLGSEWPDFLGWWFRPGGWAAQNVRAASPKALLKGWQRNVEEWRDPQKFAREQAEAQQQRSNRREPPQDARFDGGDAFKELK